LKPCWTKPLGDYVPVRGLTVRGRTSWTPNIEGEISAEAFSNIKVYQGVKHWIYLNMSHRVLDR